MMAARTLEAGGFEELGRFEEYYVESQLLEFIDT